MDAAILCGAAAVLALGLAVAACRRRWRRTGASYKKIDDDGRDLEGGNVVGNSDDSDDPAEWQSFESQSAPSAGVAGVHTAPSWVSPLAEPVTRQRSPRAEKSSSPVPVSPVAPEVDPFAEMGMTASVTKTRRHAAHNPVWGHAKPQPTTRSLALDDAHEEVCATPAPLPGEGEWPPRPGRASRPSAAWRADTGWRRMGRR